MGKTLVAAGLHRAIAVCNTVGVLVFFWDWGS